jgi:hypothetical protein
LTTTSALQAAFATQLALLPQSMLQKSAVHVPPLGQAPAPSQSRLQLLPASQRTTP